MSNHEEQLEQARNACQVLTSYTEYGQGGVSDVGLPVLILAEAQRPGIRALVEQFCRLDAKEQRQRSQGHHGKKGGRPKQNKHEKKTPRVLTESEP